ncbi:hypothetical protein [Neobacillus mesonae]|uniref:hypothetical protein n=1 Tax=Neobacillus mesonae TaxID=1193713 RepID=UPI00203DA890|nr:hypothetical protein [Neobacillus mesonae]MCM3567024.1 hypothetical protein [Neobacillus mesonae]
MGLKSALFQMKDAILNHQIQQSEEEFIQELETNNNLRSGTLPYYYNFLMMKSLKQSDSGMDTAEDSKKINRKWTKNEIEFMFQYISERQEEGALNITEILEEAAQLLDRGYQSVNYKYYSTMKAMNKKQTSEPKSGRITTISKERIPVISTEVIPDLPKELQSTHQESSKNEDLLDLLSGLITNVEKLPGIQLNELLKSLLLLTNMALQNQDAAKKVETMKSEMTSEKEATRERMQKLEQQLIMEKKRNDDLQIEVSKLAKEIMAFNQLGDAAKIQNLKSYNQRLNYIIDSFGVVLQVGS